jgi:AraC-like DNA-binding protein
MGARGVEAFLWTQRANGTLYRELPPAPDLAELVACVWIRVVSPRADAVPFTVVPDGCADIMTVDHRAPLFVGPDTMARTFALPSGVVITGLRLRPGALRAVAGCRAEDLVDTTVPLRDLAGSAARLDADLHAVDTLARRFALLEQWVRDRVRMRTHDRSIVRACRGLALRGATDMDDVAAALGWSVRTMRREFIAACGYGPKMMHRILRVQQAVRRAHRARHPVRVSALAATLGFADQAHMTREFRAILGFTPKQYLVHSDPAFSRWLDADWPE